LRLGPRFLRAVRDQVMSLPAAEQGRCGARV